MRAKWGKRILLVLVLVSLGNRKEEFQVKRDDLIAEILFLYWFWAKIPETSLPEQK